LFELPKYEGWKPYEDRIIIAVTDRIVYLKKSTQHLKNAKKTY